MCPWGFPSGSVNKESACNAGDLGSILGLGRSPGVGNGNPLQYSCLENFMDREAYWATVCGAANSRAWLWATNTFTFNLSTSTMLLLGKKSSVRCANSPSFLSLPHIHTWNKLVNVSDSSFKNTLWLVLLSINTTLVQMLHTSHLNYRKASDCLHAFSILIHNDHTVERFAF